VTDPETSVEPTADPPAPRDRDRTSRAAIRFAGTAYAAFLVAGLLSFFVVAFPFNPWIAAMPFWARVLVAAVAVVSFVVAAVNSEAPTGVRAVAALAATAGLVAAFFPYALYASPFLVFVAWALLARFRGRGYFALLLVAVGVAGQVFFTMGLLLNVVVDLPTVTLILMAWVVVQLLLLIAVVAAANALERSQARNLDGVPA
jgi:hypothetical protein